MIQQFSKSWLAIAENALTNLSRPQNLCVASTPRFLRRKLAAPSRRCLSVVSARPSANIDASNDAGSEHSSRPPSQTAPSLFNARHDIRSPNGRPPYIESSLDPSLEGMLPFLRSQSNHYAQVYIQGRPYLVTAGDSLRLPFVMQAVNLGDVIRLNRATVFGSRDFTLKAGATNRGEERQYIDERLYVARATVVNVVLEPLRVKIKKKPRIRHARHFYSQHSYTVLRISELRPASEDEWQALVTEEASN